MIERAGSIPPAAAATRPLSFVTCGGFEPVPQDEVRLGTRHGGLTKRPVPTLSPPPTSSSAPTSGDSLQDFRSLQRFRAIASYPDVRFFCREHPDQWDDPLLDITPDRAFDHLEDQRWIWVGSPQVTKPVCITWQNLQEGGRPSVLELASELGASDRDAMALFIRGEGPLPGLDAAQSLATLDDLHARVQANVSSSDPNQFYAMQPLFMAGWAYQVASRALEQHGTWASALPSLEACTVSLGPHSTLKALERMGTDIPGVDDPAKATRFFDLASAVGAYEPALATWHLVEESPERASLVASLLPRFSRGSLPRAQRAPAIEQATRLCERFQPTCPVGQRESDRLLRLLDILPAFNPADVVRLYGDVSEQLRGEWKDRTFDEIAENATMQALFTQDAREIFARMQTSLRKPALSEEGLMIPGPGIEQSETEVIIGGVRVKVRPRTPAD